MNRNNDYYRIAHKDLLYMQAAMSVLPLYNQISVSAQQVTEKLLKSIAELVCPDTEDIMGSHNLKMIYNEIVKYEPEIRMDRKSLAALKDYYFEARYPGDNYIDVTEEECIDSLNTMYDVLKEVNKFRTRHGLPVFTYKGKYPIKADNFCFDDDFDEKPDTPTVGPTGRIF